MQEVVIILIGVALIYSLWWGYKRWFRVFHFGEGVRMNGEYILRKLEERTINYEARMALDGSGTVSLPMDIGGNVAVSVDQYAEIAMVSIKVNTYVGDREVRKSLTIMGCNVPAPNIKIDMSPLHCWGFDPHTLTRFSRDPKFSTTRYVLTPVYPNVESQLLPEDILDAAAQYLSTPVSENLVEMYWNDMHTEREWTDEEMDALEEGRL